MQPITNGARLVQLLKESKTGQSKLDVLRAHLRAFHEAEGRTMTSKELIAKMENDSRFSLDTVAKAKLIAETGQWERKDPEATNESTTPIEDILAGKSPTAPVDPPRDTADLGRLENRFGKSTSEPVGQPEVDKAVNAEREAEAVKPGITKGKADPFDTHKAKAK